MPHAIEHCHRPWWKRPPFWFIVIAAVLLLGVLVIEHTDKPALTPYSTFLDQLEAGSVAGVTFQGTQIDGSYKHPLGGVPSSGSTQQDIFSSRVPDFGDPTLIPELRKQHVVIIVNSPSQWTSLLARLPWPMLLFLGVAIVAGLVRLMRGGKPGSGSTGPAMPMHGMMGLLSRLFGKQQEAGNPPAHDDEEPKSR